MSTAETGRMRLSWLYLAWFSLAVTTIAFAVFGAIARGNPNELILSLGWFDDIATFAIILWDVGMVAAVVLLVIHLRVSKLSLKDVGIRGVLTGKGILYAIVGWVIIFFIYYGVDAILSRVGIDMFWRGESDSKLLSISSPWDWVILIIGPVILSPITEEMIFRGYVFGTLLQRLGVFNSMIIAALIFASVHVFFGPGLMVYIFLSSFVTAYIYWKLRTLYPCILLHFLINLWAYVFVPILFF